MIFRLSQKLNAKIKAGSLPALPLDENPFADWSAHLFVADRTQYIILSNTKSLYSTVMFGKGITNDSHFIERALGNIREFMEGDGQEFVYHRFIVPATASARFAKALDRSVTASMNDMVKHATYYLAQGDQSPIDVGTRLNEIPMSALKHDGSPYGFSREAFKELVGGIESCEKRVGPINQAQPTLASAEANLFGALFAFHKKIMTLLQESSLDDENLKVVSDRIKTLLDTATAEMKVTQQMNLTEKLGTAYEEAKRLVDELSGISGDGTHG